MPQCTSGIAATWWKTNGRRATFASCWRAASSTPTPRVHALIGTPAVSMSSCSDMTHLGPVAPAALARRKRGSSGPRGARVTRGGSLAALGRERRSGSRRG